MIIYKLTYLDNNGKEQIKTVQMDNESELQPYIQALGLNVMTVDQLPPFYKLLNLRSIMEQPKPKQVIEILENLQVVVRSGLPMHTSLMDIAGSADNSTIGDMLMDVAHRIQMSMSLSEAMVKYEKVFTETTIGLIRIGEETGQLEETLKNAANYLTRIDKLRSKVKSALIIPGITLAALGGAMTFWMVWVMPQLVGAFESFDMDLPVFTKMFMAMSRWTQSNLGSLVMFIIAFLFVFFTARRKIPAFHYLTDKMLLKAPIFGNILTLYNYAFVAEYTRLMIAAGLPLFQALGILTQSISNDIFKEAIGNAREDISQGSSLSMALTNQMLFSPMVLRMVAVGEQTGHLEEQLQYVSDHYFAKVDYISDNIAKIIQPIITVVLGGFMIVMLLAFMMPITDMVQNLMKTN